MEASSASIPEAPEPRRWIRAVGMLVLALSTVVFAPSVLIGIPFVLLVVLMPGPGAGAWGIAALFVFLVASQEQTGSVWFLERGWALLVGGAFAAVTLRWPSARFTSRGLAAVGAAAAVSAAYLASHPAVWSSVDWLIRERIGGDLAVMIEGARSMTDLNPAFQASLDDLLAAHLNLYPSLIALSTFGALGVSWWLYVRVSLGRSDGLGALRGFAFPDFLVWLVVAGVGFLLLGTAWARAVGTNTLVFMAVLYALRGLGVVIFFKGGVTAVGVLIGGLVTLIAAPVVLGAAVMIGLGDTWLGLRPLEGGPVRQEH